METSSGKRRGRGISILFLCPKCELILSILLLFFHNTEVQFFLKEVPRSLLHELLVLGVDDLEATRFRGMDHLRGLDEGIPTATPTLYLQRLDHVL